MANNEADSNLPELGDYDPLHSEPVKPEPVISSNTMDKCPKCGSPDITYLSKSGVWICSFCRFQWDPNAAATFDDLKSINEDLRQLLGTVIMSSAVDIESNVDQLTLKCQACGAEVVINTADSLRSRCHWCRQTLSVNEKVPNGAVPDAILPFSLIKEQAVAKIAAFVTERKYFALPKFTKEFNPDNVIGVYLPYMLVDGNLSAEIHGQAEIETRSWTEGSGSSETKYYNADVYSVSRKFDFQVDDLTIEASSEKANIQVGKNQKNTNNIINSILPFDTKKAIAFKSAFTEGFNAEKRDSNMDFLEPKAKDQFMSIARAIATDSADQYSKRGIRWDQEHIEIKGARWTSVYLPVWLYSYYQTEKKLMHYVAVNGRTGATMGSIPVNYKKLWLTSLAIGIPLEILSWPFVGSYYSALGR